MIRATSVRLFALIAGVAVVLSCDAGNSTGMGDVGSGPPTSGGGDPVVGGDGRQPTVAIDTPAVYGQLVNIGDSILVAVRVRDASGIASIKIAGLSVKGDPNVGTQVITERYQSVVAPQSGNFPAGTGTSDTTIRRILFPAAPIDSTPDSLVIRAIVVDNSGIADTATQVVRLVVGPRVTILTPLDGDSVRAGTRVNVQFRATDLDGVAEATLRVQGEATWPTPLDVTFPRFTWSGSPQEVIDTASFLIPADAPARSRIRITASAVDAARDSGAAAPITLRIRSTESAAPMVKQVVPARAERNDTISINASGGNGIATIGYIIRDNAGVGPELFRADTTLAGTDANVLVRMRLNLPASMQGRTVGIISFASDRSGRTGYSVAATANVPVTNIADAHKDTMLVVFGSTFALPRVGLGGDIAVNPTNGHVFVSNTRYNRLEVWQQSTLSFDPAGVSVGAEPWGLAMSVTNPNELLVANSGGTNISRVNIGSTTVSNIRESSRILTRNTVAYDVTETRDQETGKIRIVVRGPISWSDRPQYIAQSAAGRIYYSTRPTQTAREGTLRYLDPAEAYPESRQIYSYGSPAPGLGQLALFNLDAVSVNAAPADSPISDELILCDHPSGTNAASVCAGSRYGIASAMAALQAAVPTTDARAVDISIESLALTDTTFVAWSGNHDWLAFGEGGGRQGARVMLANDPVGTSIDNVFFSPGLDVEDLVDNAAETVFGLALDLQGRSLAVHGTKTYFGAVERPFHLRMQGEFNTFSLGAGVAYHPQANIDPATPGPDRNDPTRIVFVASENGSIELIDGYYFVSRGRLVVRNPLYGPLRAAMPSAAETAAGIVVKLYGLTANGLVVIDVTNADIKPVP